MVISCKKIYLCAVVLKNTSIFSLWCQHKNKNGKLYLYLHYKSIFVKSDGLLHVIRKNNDHLLCEHPE